MATDSPRLAEDHGFQWMTHYGGFSSAPPEGDAHLMVAAMTGKTLGTGKRGNDRVHSRPV